MTDHEPKPSSNPSPAVLDLLRTGRRFVLSGHERPDGDCIGAQAALASVLRALGKELWIINPDSVEPQFDYLAQGPEFRSWSGGALPQHDVAVLLDISELSRCGDLGLALGRADSKKLVIDHHLFSGQPWWDAAYVDVTASATGLLVHRIAAQLGVELDAVGAMGVFTSLVTDTGWFKYSNTDGETLRVAGELVAGGVDPNALYGAIYQRQRSAHPLETSAILASTVYHAGGRLAVICAPRNSDQAALAPDSDDALDILRSVREVEVVLFLRELATGMVKLSARSKTDYDVNALAREFGGGGHRKASGATIEGNLEEVHRRLVQSAIGGFGQAVGDVR